MSILKDKEFYLLNKKLFNKDYNEIWKSISYEDFVGNCSYLYRKYAPKSYEDFFMHYIVDSNNKFDCETMTGDPHHGRSFKQLCVLAGHYYTECMIKIPNDDITIDSCLQDIINHVIIETFDGHKAERMVMKMIENNSDSLYCTDEVEETDIKYGVDITVRNKEDDSVAFYIQVKPISTFYKGDNNMSLVHDRKHFYEKEKEFHEHLAKTGRNEDIKPTYFICYDGNALNEKEEYRFLLNRGNKYAFLLNELCDNEGHSLLTSSKELKWREYVIG